MAEYAARDESQEDGTPEVVENDEDLLAECRERLKKCIDDYEEERKKQRDDLLFSTLEQWPSEIRSARENDPNGARPCLTIDQINQYIVQVVNDIRQNRPAVKVRPVDDQADVETAEVFQGVIRQIEDQSTAQIAYIGAVESAVRIGEGYFRFVTEYEDEKSFNQAIKIKKIPDTFCCYLGPHVMPTGEDCEYGFIFEDIPDEKFRRQWPKAKWQSTDFDELESSYGSQWYTDKRIRVAEYFYFEYAQDELLFLQGGETMLMSDYNLLEEKPEIEDRRPTSVRRCKWCKLTGLEILEKRDWPGKYIPIVKVTGKEAWVDGRRVVWGLVRPAKDSLRMYNYWASTITEKIALSPKAPYIGAKGQFEGLEDRWRDANVKNFPYLEYNPITVDGLSVSEPKRQPPAPIEVAMVQQLQVIREDVKASLGMYKASLGQEQPNQSGRAILALVRESDTGTYHFQDNAALSIQHGGRIMVDLVPKYYDVPRVTKILGEDGKYSTAEINPEQPQAVVRQQDEMGKIKSIYNLSVGTYDVSVTVGPSYNTKRMEAATLFTDLANSSKDPISAAVVRYLAIKNSDFNGAQQAAEMLEKLLPPHVVPKDGEEKLPPGAAAKMMKLEMMAKALQKENQELKAGLPEAQMKIQSHEKEAQLKLQTQSAENQQKLQFEAQNSQAQMQLEREKAAAEIQIEREKVAAEIQLEREKAAAQIEIEKMKAGVQVDTARMKIDADKEVKLQTAAMDSSTEVASAKASQPVVNVVDSSAAKPMEALAKSMESVAQAVAKSSEKPEPKKENKSIRIVRNNGQIVGAEVTG